MCICEAGKLTAEDGCIGIVETQYYTFAEPPHELALECGKTLGPVTLAYETYGALNAEKSNAILVCHALSGDAHAAGVHEVDDNPGWWEDMIGPGKAFDTNRYFVVCSNVIGGCKGSTGPSSISPKTGKPYALDFPMITVADMVNAQRHLIDHLGIERLLSVAGGSMGGMQVLQWVASYPARVRSAIPIATALKHSPQQIAFNEVVRQSIMADPDWRQGNYYEYGQPAKGLAVARMIGHITFMSDQSMEEKFSRRLKNGDYSFKFGADFEVEGYLRYRGDSFVKRFDANSYLYITKAIDYFDLSNGKLVSREKPIDTRFLVISFKSDWLYPSYQSQEIVRQLKAGVIEATSCEIASTYGHDSFLVEVDEQTHLIKHFLEKTYYGNGTLESGI
jgi:homoserine O-acetyltransferase